jgi:hypothetical protein
MASEPGMKRAYQRMPNDPSAGRTARRGLRLTAQETSDGLRPSSTRISLAFLTAIVAFFGLYVFAGAGFGQEAKPKEDVFATLGGGTVSRVELLDVLDHLDQHTEDSELDMLLGVEPFTEDREMLASTACARKDEFADFFERHGFNNFTTDAREKKLLVDCMKDIFLQLDAKLNFLAPGYRKAYSLDYLVRATDLAYRCGYRSERLFALFSIASWLIDPEDLQKDYRFQCIETGSPSYERYGEDGHLFALNSILQEIFFVRRVTGSWEYTRSYFVYEEMILENRDWEACLSLYSSSELLAEILFDLETISSCAKTLDRRRYLTGE